MTPKRLLLTTAILCSPLAFAGQAFAGTFTANATGAPGATTTLNVAFAGEGATEDAQADITINTANFTASAPQVLVPGSTCVILNSGTTLRAVPPSGAGTPLVAASTNYCSCQIAIGAAVPEANYPLTTSFLECAAPGGPQACTFSGAITVATGPAPEVDPTPAPGPITINDGAGDANPTNAPVITLASTGTAPLTLSVAGATAQISATLSSTSVAPGSSATLTIGCTAPNAGPFSTNVVVTTNDTTGGEGTLTYPVTCNGVTAPEFSASLSAVLTGAPGTTANGSIAVQNTGTAPLTITCGAPTAGFTLVTPPTSPVAAGGSTTIGISCATSVSPGATTTGSLVCTTNDTDEGTVTFALTCSSQVIDVPTMGSTGKALLASLLAAVGLLGFALRRKLV